MAAKSKKRLSRNENKLLKLEKLQLNDVLCSICQSILIEPVTLPCYHDFCHGCFSGSVENNALCCPLCRLRIGSWLRTTTKQNNLVNIQLWNFIKSKFSKEIDIKLKGDDIDLPEDKPLLRLSAPGEIRSEYEAELRRLRAERQQLEQKHLKETELLVKKIQEEEEEAHNRYLERLKQDEILAQKIHQSNAQDIGSTSTSHRQNIRNTAIKQRPKKANKIDNYLCKQTSEVKDPLLTDDNSSTDSSTPKAATVKGNSRASPEMVPSYSRYLKSVIDKKNKNVSGLWNKENGQDASEVISTENDTARKQEDDAKSKDKVTKTAIQSLPVSLPYTGILQHKKLHLDNRNLETGSTDSMQQELCYFKPILPIEGNTPTSFKAGAGLPLKVPCKRKEQSTPTSDPTLIAPSRSQYLDGLCRLRDISLAQNLPSAFVIAINLLRVTKRSPTKCETKTKASLKQMPDSPILAGIRRTAAQKKEISEIDGITKLANEKTLRRTRSMGSIHKAVNETTPKKAKIKDRKVSSERKRYLRSDSKKTAKISPHSPTLVSEPLNNNKISLVTKKLSSPLENCDVKKILEEQLRIERMIEQEKNDLELARKMDAELNGRRRRSAVKRQVTLNGLRPAKKLKV